MNTREYRRPEWNACLGKAVMTELTESQLHLIGNFLNPEERIEFFVLHHQDSKWIHFSEHPKLHNPNNPPREFVTPPIDKIKRPIAAAAVAPTPSPPPQTAAPQPMAPQPMAPQPTATPATKTPVAAVSFEFQGLKKTPALLVSVNGPNLILDTPIESNFQFFVIHAKAAEKSFELVGFRGPEQQKIPNLIQLLPSSALPSFIATLGGRTEGGTDERKGLK